MTMRTNDPDAKSEVRSPKGDPRAVPRSYSFPPSPTEYHPEQARNADSATPSIPAAYRAGPRPRRRSAATAPKGPVVQREPGLDVFPAMTSEEMPPEELLFLLMRLLNTA